MLKEGQEEYDPLRFMNSAAASVHLNQGTIMKHFSLTKQHLWGGEQESTFSVCLAVFY